MAKEQSNLLNIGDHFGDYVVERLLGMGGMGTVYLVRASNGKRYALKVMKPEDGDTLEIRKRFRREAEFAMKIRHGNLIPVHAAGEDEKTGLCYLVMDYMPGGSLADLIRKNGALPIKDAISIATRIAEALDVAHLNGVIHRDVKPDNILFSAKGVPMLTDLGVAKFDDSRTNLTTTGMVIGTPAYMAPEQMLNSRNVDGRADIYALGIVLYQMLAGHRPNENDTAVELMAKAIKGEPLPDVRTLRPEVSAAVAYILSLMCAPKPEDRPTTLRDVVKLFRDASFGRLVVPERPTAEIVSADVSTPSDVKRGPAVWVIVSLGVALGSVAAGMWLWADVRQRKHAQESPSVVTNVIEHVVPKTVTVTNLLARGNEVDPPSVSAADTGECDFSMLGEQAEKYVQMDGSELWTSVAPFLGDENRRESPTKPFTARERIDLTKPMVFCDALNKMKVPPHASTNVVRRLWHHEYVRNIPLGSLLSALPNIHRKIRPLLDGHASIKDILSAIQEELDKDFNKGLDKASRHSSSLKYSSSEVESARQMIFEMTREMIAPRFLEFFESGRSVANTSTAVRVSPIVGDGAMTEDAAIWVSPVVGDGATAEATATATVNVQVQVPLPKPPPPPEPEPVFEKLRVCVLDFTTIDINGQIRFLSGTNQKIDVPPQCTLNDADRKSINDVMQGFVRLVDAYDNARTDEANRGAQVDDNVFRRQKALDIWNTTVHGQSRPMVIGAEYLESYLGRHSDVFACLDRGLMVAAMGRLQKDPDFPTDYQLKLARASGATHLIYGAVGDLSSRENSFSGFGISVKTTNFSLDVIVKVVDLLAQQTVHANTYTGTYREQRPISGVQFDNNIFQSLMKSALEQAAEDLYDMCKPGRRNKIRVTPLPEKKD